MSITEYDYKYQKQKEFISLNKSSNENKEDNKEFYIIAIGVSANHINSLIDLIKSIPADCDCAFIIIIDEENNINNDFDIPSLINKISTVTNMNIVSITDCLKIKKNTIYISNNKRYITVYHSKLYTNGDISKPTTILPLDSFLKSLGEDIGDYAIAIICNSEKKDGFIGIRTIKWAGGMVIVKQNTSEQYSDLFNNAYNLGFIDFVLKQDEIIQQLINYINHPFIIKAKLENNIYSNNQNILHKIIYYISQNKQTDFSYYKPDTIIRKIKKRMIINELNTLDEYFKIIQSKNNELDIIFKDLLIGVTSIFRDNELFDTIKNIVIPSIFFRKDKNQAINIWVSATSTGEEAYSLAILIDEFLEKNPKNNQINFFATDIDMSAINIAKTGAYCSNIINDISQERIEKYFNKKNCQYIIKDNIKNMISFSYHNLVKDKPLENIDLLLCRNFLIYLQPIPQENVLIELTKSLNANSFLILGISESLGDLSKYYKTLDKENKVFIYNSNMK